MLEKNTLYPEIAVAHFFGSTPVRELSPFGNGNINDTWKLSLDDAGKPKAFLLQRLNHLIFRQPEAVMANIARVAAHLRANEYPHALLEPIGDADGQMLFQDASGNYWRVFPFFEKTRTLDAVDSPVQAFEAARAFGQFLEALSGLNPADLHEIIPGFHDSLARREVFRKAIEKDAAGRLNGVLLEVDFILDQSVIFQTIADHKLPIRAVHNDAKIGNILLDESADKAVAVIDWDTIMPGCLLSDLGDIARTMASTCSEDESNTARVVFSMPTFEAICKGFIPAVSGMLSLGERECLHLAPRWIVLEQAMRFLGDYLNGDVYYKIKHPLHNLERARNQLALYCSALQQEEAIQAAIRAALR